MHLRQSGHTLTQPPPNDQTTTSKISRAARAAIGNDSEPQHVEDPAFQDLQDAFDSFMEDGPAELEEPRSAGGEQGTPDTSSDKLRRETHPYLNGCHTDASGAAIPPGSPPSSAKSNEDWTPYGDRLQFEMAEFLFKREQMAQSNVNWLMEAFAAFGYAFGLPPPFENNTSMHNTIDATPLGDAPWTSFTAQYTGEKPTTNVPAWMDATYDVWCRDPRTVIRNMLANPDFKDEFDAAPYREYDKNDKQQFTNLMSGNWAWRQADAIIRENPENAGAMFTPIVLGSDKTTVSVATGQNEYYPLYISLGNVTNNPLKAGMTTPEVVQCPDGFYRRVIYGLGPYIADYPEQVLASCIVSGWCPLCPTDRTRLDEPGINSRRSREHTELLVQAFDLTTLWDEYGVVGDIVPFTNDFPRADIHELLSGDLLHQVIKGSFKDHLVTWVEEYLHLEHGEAKGKEIMDEIDRRISASPLFPGLRHFHQGRDFKQWTGDDSKALMKVYIPAIVGLVPFEMVRALSSFTEFCYLARQSVISDESLQQLEAALQEYHQYREIFVETGVRPDGFSNLPRQHALDHYPRHIREFGAPNGLCSSITESKHIKAVKEPWRRSNRFEALGQMLLTNQRLDKLAAARSDFEARGMLRGSLLFAVIEAFEAAAEAAQAQALRNATPDSSSQSDEDELAEDTPNAGDKPADDLHVEGENENFDPKLEDEGEAVQGPRVMASVMLARRPVYGYYPKRLVDIANFLDTPKLPDLVARFVYYQVNNIVDEEPPEIPPYYYHNHRVHIFKSAIATFHAPSDLSGVGGMRRERIRATTSWRAGPPRFDCIFAEVDPDARGFLGLSAARVRLFFSFVFEGVRYPCALVEWFSPVSDEPDDETGMWVVEPDLDVNGQPICDVIHIDSIVRCAHLLPTFGSNPIPLETHFSNSLDLFRAFYVSKYADHHSHEIAS
ncbi:hypothetical protein EUX98_g8604 [Antrodiella citrinella]|uniref:Uncharacterized protein n=1 Tax=Antrodiella citrinella TaxID=2447956 RepID=A0A4S4M7C4_9APHY|nr:hypothetical protein EUX98_g8604 [Antrodiella citrinella]